MAIQKTVLVVEDEATFLEALSFKLRQEGFRVVEARDAIGASVVAKQQRPDLVILDFAMPAGSGGDVYHRLREAFQDFTPPVIFISAFSFDMIKKALPEWVNVGFQPKPVDFDKLMADIRTMLGMKLPSDKPVDLNLDDA